MVAGFVAAIATCICVAQQVSSRPAVRILDLVPIEPVPPSAVAPKSAAASAPAMAITSQPVEVATSQPVDEEEQLRRAALEAIEILRRDQEVDSRRRRQVPVTTRPAGMGRADATDFSEVGPPAHLARSGVVAGHDLTSASDVPAYHLLQLRIMPMADILRPDAPVLLRFTITNPTSEPITIPVSPPMRAGEGVTLPMALVLGTPSAPALTIQAEDANPEPVIPPAASSSLGDIHELTIGPRGVLGAEFDAREYARTLRYPGGYTLAWRPFGTTGPVARVPLRIEGLKDAIIVTDFGKITVRLNYDTAPTNVENFLELSRAGFYQNLTFHRIVPEYMISGGCPAGDGSGRRPDGKLIPAELTNEPFDIGTVAMSHLPDDVDTASCQFFIMLAPAPELQGRYTVLGQARDNRSLQTLRAISDVPVGRNYRPLRTVFVRSINLVDREPRSANWFEPAVTLPPTRRGNVPDNVRRSLQQNEERLPAPDAGARSPRRDVDPLPPARDAGAMAPASPRQEQLHESRVTDSSRQPSRDSRSVVTSSAPPSTPPPSALPAMKPLVPSRAQPTVNQPVQTLPTRLPAPAAPAPTVNRANSPSGTIAPMQPVTSPAAITPAPPQRSVPQSPAWRSIPSPVTPAPRSNDRPGSGAPASAPVMSPARTATPPQAQPPMPASAPSRFAGPVEQLAPHLAQSAAMPSAPSSAPTVDPSRQQSAATEVVVQSERSVPRSIPSSRPAPRDQGRTGVMGHSVAASTPPLPPVSQGAPIAIPLTPIEPLSDAESQPISVLVSPAITALPRVSPINPKPPPPRAAAPVAAPIPAVSLVPVTRAAEPSRPLATPGISSSLSRPVQSPPAPAPPVPTSPAPVGQMLPMQPVSSTTPPSQPALRRELAGSPPPPRREDFAPAPIAGDMTPMRLLPASR